MRSIALYILILASVFFSSTAQAQLFLEEGKVVLAVEGGDRINKTLTVSNTSAEEVRAKVYWEDFQYQSPYDGTKKFFPAGVGPASASQWVNHSPQEISLPPFGKQKIDYSISVPTQIEKGYYGVLFFERLGTSIKDISGLDIVTRVGCLFFIEPKNATKKASIEKISVKGQNVSGSFVNSSAVTLIPRMVYYIMEEGGMVKDRGEVKKLYVPASETADWELPVPADLAAGHYIIVMNMDLGEENVVTKEIGLTKDAGGLLTVEQPKD